MSDPSRGRIAIKLGSSTSASGSKPSRPKQPPSALGKRPRAWGDDAGSDDSDDGHGRHEVITGFGASGAETERSRRKEQEKEKKKEYIIARQPNRDWRAEMRAQRPGRNLLPEEARRAAQNGVAVKEEGTDPASGIKWGLSVKEKKKEEEEDDPPVKKEEPDEQEHLDAQQPKTEPQQDDKPPTAGGDDNNDDDDKAALSALLGRDPADGRPASSSAAIPPAAAPTSEADAYRRDVRAAGEASTLADYEAMPVEEFGAALLRGMGWDGEERGTSRHRQVKRRPNRLGLGAKELKGDEDLGGWNQGVGGGGGKKRPRPRLDEYRREESRRKEARGGSGRDDSYRRERERERDHRHRDGDRDRDGHRHNHRGYDRDRRR